MTWFQLLHYSVALLVMIFCLAVIACALREIVYGPDARRLTRPWRWFN